MSNERENDIIIEDETTEEAQESAEPKAHAAGALQDGMIEESDEAEAEEGAEPKVDEAELLALAQNEGLIDNAATDEQDAEADTSDIDLPESEQNEIMAGIETILFMSDKPVSLPKLRSTINSDVKLAIYRKLMAKLREEFARDHRGIEIAEVSMGFQLRTKPHMSNVLRKMVKTQPLKLSTTTMEVLAIVAYKQPVTKDEVDQIRGVDSGYVLRNLMEKRLVKISGRSDLPGRPMLYGTSHEFLELFNLKDTSSLPPLHEVEAMVAASEVGAEERMMEAFDEFGKMVATSDKILFDDSKLDEELESIRSEIAAIPTSTAFIDEQKAQEKHAAKLAELAAQGLTMDAEGNIVPIGSEQTLATETVLADAEIALQVSAPITAETAEAPAVEHAPSSELEAEAAAAQAERHAEMIEEATAQAAVEAEVALVNTEALADAVNEAKAEQAELNPSPEDLISD